MQVSTEQDQEPAAQIPVARAWMFRYLLPALFAVGVFLYKQHQADVEQERLRQERVNQMQQEMQKRFDAGQPTDLELRLQGLTRQQYEQQREKAMKAPPDKMPEAEQAGE